MYANTPFMFTGQSETYQGLSFLEVIEKIEEQVKFGKPGKFPFMHRQIKFRLFREESHESIETVLYSLKSGEGTPLPKKNANYNVYDGNFPKQRSQKKIATPHDFLSKALLAVRGDAQSAMDEQEFENMFSSQITLPGKAQRFYS